MLPHDHRRVTKKAKFTWSPSEKAVERQRQNLKSLNVSNKVNELKQIENVFPKNQSNDSIINKVR